MKTVILLAGLIFLIGCASTKKPVITDITIHPDGSSTVKTNYEDSSVTIVNLTSLGERMDSLQQF